MTAAAEVLTNLNASSIFDLRGVVAVVTGGGTGIGLMISASLIANGARVYIVGPDQARLDKIAKVYNDGVAEVKGEGEMVALEGDVRLKSEATRLFEEISKREPFGVTTLFNNAGVVSGIARAPPSEPTAESFKEQYFDRLTQHDFDNVLHTNAVGPYWLTFAFLPALEKWKNSVAVHPAAAKFVPQVIMTTSMNGWTKDSRTAGHSYPYMFSKSALGQATSSLAHELLPLGIRVNGIAPGFFQTPIGGPDSEDAVGQAHWSEEMLAGLPFQVPTVKTGGTNRDMGTLALFLVANWFVNGETVLIDGGILLKYPSSY